METLSSLRQIVVLAETGNFRRAAERLGITHSALSQSVTRLEDDYGVPLFDRSRAGTVPTAFGRQLLDSARTIIARADDTKRQIRLMQNLEQGRLVIGAGAASIEGAIGNVMIDLVQNRPNLQFHLRTQVISTFEEALFDHAIDLYVGVVPNVTRPGLKYEVLQAPRTVAVCRPDHPLFKMKNPTPEDAQQFPFVGAEVPGWARDDLEKSLKGNATGLRELKPPFLVTNNVNLMRRMAMESDAISLLAEWSVREQVGRGELVIIHRQRKSGLDSAIVTLEDRQLEPIASEVIDAIKGQIGNLHSEMEETAA